MKRRDFLKTGLTASAAAVLPVSATMDTGECKEGKPFNLKYAPHFGMFRNHVGEDPIGELQFAADQGFRAFEDNDMRQKPVELQTRIGREMERLGLEMGVFVAHNIPWSDSRLATGDKEASEAFLKDIRNSVEVAKRVNAKWMTVVPGQYDQRLEIGYQTANIVALLRRAAEILEPHNLAMVLEPLNHRRDHPGLFLNTSPQAYMICKAVNSPACKILFDCYHQQITEGNLIPNIDLAWDEIAYIQIGDNPGRQEPTTGEINYLNVFKHIHGKNYQGVLGMEHGVSREGKAGEQALIAAYRSVDAFNV